MDASKIGGRLQHFVHNWKVITSDKHILSALSGYRLEFVDNEQPNQVQVPCKMNHIEAEAIDKEIQRLLEKDIIETPQLNGRFISNIFTHSKKDGGQRMTLDLSELNKSIQYYHFKMDIVETVVK